jgi:hypothetical protein
MKHYSTAIFALLLLACNAGQEAPAEAAPEPVECTAERAYVRAIEGVHEKMSQFGFVSTYDYSANQVTDTNPDYSYWVTTSVVVGGAQRYRVESGLTCLDNGVLGLGWLDIQPAP